MQRTIKIPQSIHSNYKGFQELLSIAQDYGDSCSGDRVILDFKANTWFDANLLPVIYAVVYLGKEKGIAGAYSNQTTCRLHKLLIRNGFAKCCFKLPHEPLKYESAIPFKIFLASDTYGFSAYIDSELVRYFPQMDVSTKKAISTYIQELFGNAQIHGNCRHVFTCGQHYGQNKKLDFTIVNLGDTIGDNVVRYLSEDGVQLPLNNIAWAVEPNHSTKKTNSGGIGLSLMRDFIKFNKGKFQIISGNEFWELDGEAVHTKNFDNTFPGTIINIEIDQHNRNFYKYSHFTETEIVF